MSLRLVFGFGEGRDAYQEQQAGTIGRKPPRAKGCFMMSYSIPTWFGCRVYVTHLGMEQNFRRNRGPGVFRIFSLSHHLLGGLEPWNFMTFHSVGNVRIPTDEVHHFSGGWLKPPTSHCFFWGISGIHPWLVVPPNWIFSDTHDSTLLCPGEVSLSETT